MNVCSFRASNSLKPVVRPSVCPSVRLSVCPSVRLFLCPSGKITFGPSTGARKKPPIGGLNFLVLDIFFLQFLFMSSIQTLYLRQESKQTQFCVH